MTDIRGSPSEIPRAGVVIGAYVRLDASASEAVRERLRGLEGVTLFDLDEAGKVGVILEAEDMDRAHDRLVHRVARVPGVWGVWPISAAFDDPPPMAGFSPSAQETVPEQDDL